MPETYDFDKPTSLEEFESFLNTLGMQDQPLPGANPPSEPETALPAPQAPPGGVGIPPPVPAPPSPVSARPRPPPVAPPTPAPSATPPTPDSTPVTPAPTTSGEQPTDTGYDPIKMLQARYADAIKASAAAREHDLGEQEKNKWLMQTMSLGHHAAGNQGAAAGFGLEAAKLMSSPLHMQSLQKRAEVDTAQAKAMADQLATEKASWAMDPNSPLAKESRMALVSSPQFEKTAQEYAKANGLSVMDARKVIYGNVKKMSPVGMDAYMGYMKQGGDYSEQRSREAHNYAQAAESKERAEKIHQETKEAKTLFASMSNPNSAISHHMRETIRLHFPHLAAGNPRFNKMTAQEIMKTWPDIFNTSANILKWQQEYDMQLKADTMVDDEFSVKTENPRLGEGGLYAGRPVANRVGVEGRAKFRQQTQAARQATEAADELFKAITGPEDTVSVAVRSPEGQRILNALHKFADNASALTPEANILKEELKGIGANINPAEFIFGAKGKKSSVKAALAAMNSNHINAAAPYNKDKIIRGEIPDQPPTYLPMTIETVKAGNKTIPGYQFQIGDKLVTYYRVKGEWRKDVKEMQ